MQWYFVPHGTLASERVKNTCIPNSRLGCKNHSLFMTEMADNHALWGSISIISATCTSFKLSQQEKKTFFMKAAH